jgi:hypothetical protein
VNQLFSTGLMVIYPITRLKLSIALRHAYVTFYDLDPIVKIHDRSATR